MRLGQRGNFLGNQLGFSLVELMVVLVLIAIMTAMIIPEMKGTFEDALLRSTGRKLIDVFSIANSQAITRNQLHRVRLDLKKGRYIVERSVQDEEGAGSFAPVQDIPGGEGDLDTRISIEFRRPDAEPDSINAPNQEPPLPPEKVPENRGPGDIIAFYPDGTADAGEIVLRDRDGFQLALRLNPTTARVRIVELQSK